ncbi:unnamed protein product [Larinioides sclopetarius]|uniref:Pleiotrophin/Midkine C-terminal domain-containing protein n=1 Tax=Larinioides sclopetarius TaxID=280406 RepID=A0AAV2B8W9_9ARAC
MKAYLVACFLLSTFILIEAVSHLQEDVFHDSDDQEVVYRVSRGIHSKKKEGECRYKKGPWSECDSSNMQKKTLTLKKGDNSCEQTKVISRKCKKVCKYNKQGAWSECDSATGRKSKVLVLKSGSPQTCEANKKITKPCHKGSNHKNSGKGRQDYDEDE